MTLFKRFEHESQELRRLCNLEETCYYVSFQDLECSINLSSSNFNVLHLNIRSLIKKQSDLNLILEEYNSKNITMHALLLCETFLNEYSKKLVKIAGYTYYFLNRSSSNGGGVGLLIHDSVTVKDIVHQSLTSDIEALFVNIDYGGELYTIGEIYRIPNTSVQVFIELSHSY